MAQARPTLVLSGSGLQILTGSNTYTGFTQISGGTLRIGNGGNARRSASTSGVTLANNATLAFNHADAVNFTLFNRRHRQPVSTPAAARWTLCELQHIHWRHDGE